MKTLLVPIDFSLRSRQALRYAVELARGREASIVVLHVLPPPSSLQLHVDAYLGRPMPRLSEEARLEAETRLGALIGSVETEGVAVDRAVEPGEPAATIVRMAVELGCDLIVIGTHARIGMKEWVLGSIAHRVITCAPCPVVTLRGDEPHAPHVPL